MCSIRFFDTQKSKEVSSFIIQIGLPLQPAPPALLTGFPISTLEGLRPKTFALQKVFLFQCILEALLYCACIWCAHYNQSHV